MTRWIAVLALLSAIYPPASLSAEPAAAPKPAEAADVAAPSVEPKPGDQPPAPAAPPQAAPADEGKLRALVRETATANGLPPEIAEAVADVESGFDPKAVGGVGEIGLMQVLPSTARMLGFSQPLPKLFEPEVNVRYGVRYLSEAWRKTKADICATVMKYRAGHGETRYSQKSVAYCVRVRELLAARGYTVTGTVPVATFGDAAGVVRIGRAGRGIGRRLANGRMRVVFNWRSVDAKRRELDKAGGAGLRISD